MGIVVHRGYIDLEVTMRLYIKRKIRMYLFVLLIIAAAQLALVPTYVHHLRFDERTDVLPSRTAFSDMLNQLTGTGRAAKRSTLS